MIFTILKTKTRPITLKSNKVNIIKDVIEARNSKR